MVRACVSGWTWSSGALVFRCRITGGELAVTDEVTAFRWADETEVAELADEAYAVRILDAMRDMQPTPVRAHNGIHLLTPDHPRSLT
jgi:hypothetical protein